MPVDLEVPLEVPAEEPVSFVPDIDAAAQHHEEPDDDDEAPSFLDFRKTGGIHLVLEGTKHRLRSPRMRDYRHLIGLWREEAEILEETSQGLQAFLEATDEDMKARAEAGEDNRSAEERAAWRAKNRELGTAIREATEAAGNRWWGHVVGTLGVTDTDKAVDIEDLPVFLASVDLVNRTLSHWRSVPSRSGGR